MHLKIDTGMSRGGATAADLPRDRRRPVRRGRRKHHDRGETSHLACADIPGHASVDAQLARFTDAVAQAAAAGARPEVRHLANTAAALRLPGTWFDMVRPGGAIYGLATLPGGAPDWLRPAMTVRTRLTLVKRVPRGTPVSYGHSYTTRGDCTLGLIPVGYAEGIPRQASGWSRCWPAASAGVSPDGLHGPVRDRLRSRASRNRRRGGAVRPGRLW